MLRVLARRAGWCLLLASAVRANRTLSRRPRGTPLPTLPQRPAQSDAPRRLLEAEPYKIAIAAFYALCVQRIFETCISSLHASRPRIAISSSNIEVDATHRQFILLFQALALLVWLGLYYINNVKLYLTMPDNAPRRRALAHLALTVALSDFYFLASTTGRPSTDQLLLIFGVVATDATFPLFVGPVLDRAHQIEWVVRGILQTVGLLFILLFISPSKYTSIGLSAGWLGLMLTQLLVVAPAERRWRVRRARS